MACNFGYHQWRASHIAVTFTEQTEKRLTDLPKRKRKATRSDRHFNTRTIDVLMARHCAVISEGGTYSSHPWFGAYEVNAHFGYLTTLFQLHKLCGRL